jgi:hypothetical protein
MYQEENKFERRKQIPSYSFAPGTYKTKSKAEYRTQQTFDRPCIVQNIKLKAED